MMMLWINSNFAKSNKHAIILSLFFRKKFSSVETNLRKHIVLTTTGMVDSFIRPPEGYQSAFSNNSKVASRYSAMSTSSSYRSTSGIESFSNKEPYQLVIDKNLRSMRKRAQDNTREELTSVLQRVENVLI